MMGALAGGCYDGGTLDRILDEAQGHEGALVGAVVERIGAGRRADWLKVVETRLGEAIATAQVGVKTLRAAIEGQTEAGVALLVRVGHGRTARAAARAMARGGPTHGPRERPGLVRDRIITALGAAPRADGHPAVVGVPSRLQRAAGVVPYPVEAAWLLKPGCEGTGEVVRTAGAMEYTPDDGEPEMIDAVTVLEAAGVDPTRPGRRTAARIDRVAKALGDVGWRVARARNVVGIVAGQGLPIETTCLLADAMGERAWGAGTHGAGRRHGGGRAKGSERTDASAAALR